MREPQGSSMERKWRRIGKAIAFPFWFLFWLPAHIIHTVAGETWSEARGEAGVAIGILAAALGLAIAIPVVALVLGLVLILVPLVMVAVAVGIVFAVLTWPFRYYFWRLRRWYSWRRWFYGLEEPGEKEEPWRW